MYFYYQDLTSEIFDQLDIYSIKENIKKIFMDFSPYWDDMNVEKTYEGVSFGVYNYKRNFNTIYIDIVHTADILQKYIINIESEEIKMEGKKLDNNLRINFENKFLESFLKAVLVHEINHFYVYHCKNRFYNEKNNRLLLEQKADNFIEEYMKTYGTEIDQIAGNICIALHNQYDGEERYNYIMDCLRNIFEIINEDEYKKN